MSRNVVDLDHEHLFTAIRQSVAMILFDAKGNILQANDKFAKVVGYSAEELAYMHHRDLCFDSFSYSETYQLHWRNLLARHIYHNKVERKHKDGNSIWLDAIYTPVVDEMGKVEHVIKIASDITKQEVIIKNSSDKFVDIVKGMTASTNDIHSTWQQTVVDIEMLQRESETVNEHVRKIGSMAKVVKGVASQSNLLGLNASIEAARAGDYGKGFSVVASEIRKMADSSKESAEEISEQLEKIRHSVAMTVEMIENVTERMNKNTEIIGELKNGYEHVTVTAEELSSIL